MFDVRTPEEERVDDALVLADEVLPERAPILVRVRLFARLP